MRSETPIYDQALIAWCAQQVEAAFAPLWEQIGGKP